MSSNSRIRRHLTFANVASALALFLAVGGGTTALALRGKNKVDSGDIRNGAVKTRDLANNAATGPKVNESTFTIVPDSDQLDGIDSGFFQFGNGITGAIAGGVEDGPTFGRVDLGSATLEIDCEDPIVNLNVQDDAGGTVPEPDVPTDVWIDGLHESLVVDGDSSSPVPIPSSDTAPVQVWTADDVVTDAQFNVYFDATNDLCIVNIPIDQNFPGGAPVNSASGEQDRPPTPTASGIVPR